MYAKPPVYVIVGFFAFGELILGIWLLFEGVDSARWYERPRIRLLTSP